MHPFTYSAAAAPDQAVASLAQNPAARFLAGGTNLIDEMKLGVETPPHLVDVSGLPLDQITSLPDGGLRIGATARNSDLAWNPIVRERYPVLSEALLSGASAQLRNLATTAGNLLQRTRCYYFRDVSAPCNKREPGSGCSAIPGFNRIHAILGTSDKCIATHPSDMCVAMAALDAVIHTVGPAGERKISILEFYVPYGEDPAKENVLQHGELITAVELPAISYAKRSHYLKVRDRASYEFALTSAAVIVDLDNGVIRESRIALGGIATKPWRATEAEKALAGKKADVESFAAAAKAAVAGAVPQKFNAFKIELTQRTIIAALTTAVGLPQQ